MSTDRHFDDNAHDPFSTDIIVQTTAIADGSRMTVEGEVDLHSSGYLASTLRCALGLGRVVELDLGRVTFMDSSGLQTLVVAHNSCTEDQELVVREASHQVKRLLDCTALTETFMGRSALP